MADQPEFLLFSSNAAHLVGGKCKNLFSLCALQSWLMKLTVYIVLYSPFFFLVHFTVQLPAILLSVTSSLTKKHFHCFSFLCLYTYILCFYIYSILFLSNLYFVCLS